MSTSRHRNLAPLVGRALRSFGRARAAIVSGNLDEMIDQLTQGVEILDAMDRHAAPPARVRASRKSAS